MAVPSGFVGFVKALIIIASTAVTANFATANASAPAAEVRLVKLDASQLSFVLTVNVTAHNQDDRLDRAVQEIDERD